ncbi:MAG: MoaD/ThiS family protein [Candidatus Bathyarchaeota archaeon]|nr:MAG: MoaD/ThiS family protein [Candidatus Bathyarchaeota archaeon]
MAQVTVRMMGVAKEAAGRGEEPLTIQPGSDVSGVLQTLAEKHGPGFRDAVLDPLTQTPVATLILINGIEIGNLQGLETPVNDGDTLILLSVTHGG